MDDKEKTKLWLGLVSKHTSAAKAAAEADGSVAKETAPAVGSPAGDVPPVETPPVADPLAAALVRIDALEAALTEIGKSFDGAVAKAASDQAVAKAELDKNITDAKAIVTAAQAVADRIEALAPRGAGKRIDEIGKDKSGPATPKTNAELLAENAPNVLKLALGMK